MLAQWVEDPPKSGKVQKLTEPICVWTVVIDNRRSNLTPELLYPQLLNPFTSESKGWRRVQYADDVVVVMKPKPKKAGNGPEDKT